MSRVDLHPEELLDRARRGTASKEDLARAEVHMANCAACRIEQDLLVQIEQSTAAKPNDAIVAARIRAFIARAVEERRAGAGLGKRSSARKWSTLAFAATLLLTSLGAAAVILREHRRTIVERAAIASAGARAPESAIENRGAPGVTRDEPRDETESPVDTPRDDAPPARVAPRSSHGTPKAERPKAVDESAADLFARANQLRRRDEVGDAVGVYRQLQRTFPGSAEELLSRVVLGRLFLDRQSDAEAALAQFDSYLAAASHGSLREEALVGRAVALGRLGRAAEERKAWGALLDAFPRSTSAPRARARIAAVAP